MAGPRYMLLTSEASSSIALDVGRRERGGFRHDLHSRRKRWVFARNDHADVVPRAPRVDHPMTATTSRSPNPRFSRGSTSSPRREDPPIEIGARRALSHGHSPTRDEPSAP